MRTITAVMAVVVALRGRICASADPRDRHYRTAAATDDFDAVASAAPPVSASRLGTRLRTSPEWWVAF